MVGARTEKNSLVSSEPPVSYVISDNSSISAVKWRAVSAGNRHSFVADYFDKSTLPCTSVDMAATIFDYPRCLLIRYAFRLTEADDRLSAKFTHARFGRADPYVSLSVFIKG